MTFNLPREMTRLASLAFALSLTLSTVAASAARTTRTTSQSQDASAKPSQDPRSRLSDEAAVKAEGLCARGETLSKQGDTRGALEALGNAVELYKHVYLDARPAPPPFAPDASARFRSGMSERLKRAPECIDLYTRLGGTKDLKEFERSQLEVLRAHAVGLTETDASREIFFSRETDERAVIISKPEPRFPRMARARCVIVSVTVRVRAVLGADGEVKHVFVLTEQPQPFSESSVEAAKAIKFTPAKKDGRPVSQFVTLEYGFQSY